MRDLKVVAVFGHRGPLRISLWLASRLKARWSMVTRSDANVSKIEAETPLRRTMRKLFLKALIPRRTRIWSIGAENETFWGSYVGRHNMIRIPYSTPRLPFSTGAEPQDRLSDPQALNFLYVGRLSPEKCVGDALSAFQRLPSARSSGHSFTVVGAGPMADDFKAEFASDGRIRFIGSVPYDSLDKYYLNSDVLVLPSSTEPWGLVVNEALAFGLWVIASSAVGAKELLTDQSRGVVYESGQIDDLLAALLAASLHPHRRCIQPADPTKAMMADLVGLGGS